MKNTNHLVFDIKLKNKIKLEDIEKLFDKIVEIIKVRVLKKENYVFENGGLTLFYLLAESHISGHYRIEDDYLALDIYSCNIFSWSEQKIKNLLENNLSISRIKVKPLQRKL